LSAPPRPILALTQGDPAGIGPEILLKLIGADPAPAAWQPLLVAERAALEALRPSLPDFPWDRLTWLTTPPERGELEAGGIPVLDPVGSRRDYLMAFLAPEMQVALLNVHLPLREALDGITAEAVGEALDCLGRHAGGRIALAGLNPHAGENGLLGSEEGEILAPAVKAARDRGLDVHGPESADSLFARARRDEFDWVLALYHDQGLIAVKTASFGTATNWTLGLPFLRTSVDHGTAFALAGRGLADEGPLAAVVAATLGLISGELPKKR